jgi:hypothetical protein
VRRITLYLGASIEDPGEKGVRGEYFPPRVYTKPPTDRDADWGEGQRLYLTFAVEDTGCGLNDDEKNKMFKRFSQASPKTHVEYGVSLACSPLFVFRELTLLQGSGLGLFICKELTELQGGRIGVSSTPDQGSTFKFYLKARRANSLAQAADENAQRLEKLVFNAGTEVEVHKNTSDAAKTLTSPDYINLHNRNHSSRSNPIIGSAADSDTLHVLIVEDNLINQKVGIYLS